MTGPGVADHARGTGRPERARRPVRDPRRATPRGPDDSRPRRVAVRRRAPSAAVARSTARWWSPGWRAPTTPAPSVWPGRRPSRRPRHALDLPADRRIVLYAPAWRTQHPDDVDRLLDLPRWCEALGDRAYLLLHPDAPARYDVPARLRYAVRDAGSERDLGRLLAACDLVVSDYSSVIGDAALLDVPIVLFQPDREVYVNRTHGLYPWPGSPGPLVLDESALLAEVASFLDGPQEWDARHRDDRREFASDRCGAADGAWPRPGPSQRSWPRPRRPPGPAGTDDHARGADGQQHRRGRRGPAGGARRGRRARRTRLPGRSRRSRARHASARLRTRSRGAPVHPDEPTVAGPAHRPGVGITTLACHPRAHPGAGVPARGGRGQAGRGAGRRSAGGGRHVPAVGDGAPGRGAARRRGRSSGSTTRRSRPRRPVATCRGPCACTATWTP